MHQKEDFEGVIGLEVHVQLNTDTKAFSADPNQYGAPPNTQVNEISLGHPGCLPVLNEQVVRFAVIMGLATHSEIAPAICFARKNYFYPDLPKGYQISQHIPPVCSGGYIPVSTDDQEKKIRLTRIHIEEDAGKSIHGQDTDNTQIDLNRAGVPLLEIVTEPVLSSGEEAYLFLTEIRKMVRFLNISDGDMEKGSLRCDANVSVKPHRQVRLGTRTEIKNLNSISFIRKAIDFEIERQTSLLSKGEKVVQETLRYDEASGRTYPVRTKEEAHDYRYFPEPDIPPFKLSKEYVEALKSSMPPLPYELFRKYHGEYRIQKQMALSLSGSKDLAGYFDQLVEHTGHKVAAANWMLGPVRKHLNESGSEIGGLSIRPAQLARLIELVEEGRISHSVASGTLFNLLLEQPGQDILQLAGQHGLLQTDDRSDILKYIMAALEKYPGKVREYQQGKKGLIGLFMGEVMKQSGGSADPRKTRELLTEELNKQN